MRKTIRHPTCDRMKHSEELFFYSRNIMPVEMSQTFSHSAFYREKNKITLHSM